MVLVNFDDCFLYNSLSGLNLKESKEEQETDLFNNDKKDDFGTKKYFIN